MVRNGVTVRVKYLECNDLIWFSCKQKILVFFVIGFDPLSMKGRKLRNDKLALIWSWKISTRNFNKCSSLPVQRMT